MVIDPVGLMALGSREIHYRHRQCRIVDMLVDEPALVLREPADVAPLQTDRYRRPGRRLPAGMPSIPG